MKLFQEGSGGLLVGLSHDLEQYQHPYLTVDGVLFRVKNFQIQVKLMVHPNLDGKWSLPGAFVPIDKLAIDVLREKMQEKVQERGFYAEQLQTYDALDRDERGRIISIAYLCLTRNMENTPGWFAIDGENLISAGLTLNLRELAFDHGQMIQDAQARLASKLGYSDLIKHLVPDTFRMPDLQRVYELVEGTSYGKNFYRKMKPKVVLTDERKAGLPHTTGPRAVLYRWADPQQEGV